MHKARGDTYFSLQTLHSVDRFGVGNAECSLPLTVNHILMESG